MANLNGWRAAAALANERLIIKLQRHHRASTLNQNPSHRELVRRLLISLKMKSVLNLVLAAFERLNFSTKKSMTPRTSA